MKLVYKNPKHDDMGTPISEKDRQWHVVLYTETHATLAHGCGKTKTVAKENLQKEINSILERKNRKYMEMLNYVTSQKA